MAKAPAPQSIVRIGVLGCGNVGAAFVQLVGRQADIIEARTGVRLQVASVAVRNISSDRQAVLPDGVLTSDAHAVVADPSIDLIVEVIGGIEPARELISTAIANGKPVVTANKELLANFGHELWAQSDAAGVDMLFEAAVAGGIPLIRALRESLRGEPITRVMGIVNGTTNFILTKMTEEGADYSAALSEAQRLGFAERDPTADVEGFDAAAKAAILSGLAFHTRVTVEDVYREGISQITLEDVQIAKSMDHVIKLLAIAELTPADEISVRVHPVLLHKSHPLASVRDAFNAVFIEAESAGPLMFYGRGAGGAPTASAILGDVVAVSRHIALNSIGQRETDYADRDIAPIETTKTKFLIRLEVEDKSGVLATIAQTFAEQDVSIQTVDQNGRDNDAELIIVTHGATEGELKATVEALKKLSIVTKVTSVIRVEGSTSL